MFVVFRTNVQQVFPTYNGDGSYDDVLKHIKLAFSDRVRPYYDNDDMMKFVVNCHDRDAVINVFQSILMSHRPRAFLI
jgi:hypothetical protein